MAQRERQLLMERLRADQSQLTAQKRQRLSPGPLPPSPSVLSQPLTRTDAAKQRSVLRARWSAERLAEDVAFDRRQAIVLRHAKESSAREAERLQRQAASTVQRAELAKVKAEAAEAAEAAVDLAEEMPEEEAVEEAGAEVDEVEEEAEAVEVAEVADADVDVTSDEEEAPAAWSETVGPGWGGTETVGPGWAGTETVGPGWIRSEAVGPGWGEVATGCTTAAETEDCRHR